MITKQLSCLSRDQQRVVMSNNLKKCPCKMFLVSANKYCIAVCKKDE